MKPNPEFEAEMVAYRYWDEFPAPRLRTRSIVRSCLSCEHHQSASGLNWCEKFSLEGGKMAHVFDAMICDLWIEAHSPRKKYVVNRSFVNFETPKEEETNDS